MLIIRELTDGSFVIQLEYADSDNSVSLRFSGIFTRIGDVKDCESLETRPNGVNIHLKISG